MNVSVHGCGSIPEIMQAITARIGQNPTQKWIIAEGWHQEKLLEKRYARNLL
jgi:hypothetical protein